MDPRGCIFCRDPSLPSSSLDRIGSVENSDTRAQTSNDNNLGSRNQALELVAPEGKPAMAEFLYLVMEHL
jgi:hypothetical protein